MFLRSKLSGFFGFLAGLILRVFGKSPAEVGPEDLKRAEFKTSTQRLGVRISERIRNVYRKRWLKKL